MCPSTNIIGIKDKLILWANGSGIFFFFFWYNTQQNLILWDRAPLRYGKERTRIGHFWHFQAKVDKSENHFFNNIFWNRQNTRRIFVIKLKSITRAFIWVLNHWDFFKVTYEFLTKNWFLAVKRAFLEVFLEPYVYLHNDGELLNFSF